MEHVFMSLSEHMGERGGPAELWTQVEWFPVGIESLLEAATQRLSCEGIVSVAEMRGLINGWVRLGGRGGGGSMCVME